MSKFPNCSAALEALAKGLDMETCHSFRKLRQVVMCDAWYGERGGTFTPETFHDRVEKAWEKVRQACAAHGGIKPEYGFLNPEVSRAMPPEALAKVTRIREVKKNGLHAGVIVEEDDGTVNLCLDSNCGTIKRGAGPMENLISILETAGYEVED